MSRLSTWLSNHITWQWILRAAGLAGIVFLVLFRSHPDATLIIILGAMMGLPTFLGLDQLSQKSGAPREHKPPVPPPEKEDA